MNLQEDMAIIRILFIGFILIALAAVAIKSVISAAAMPIQFFSFLIGIILTYGG